MASAVSITRQTTTAAISIGLPSWSLTLSLLLSKLRTRSETLRRARERIHPPEARLLDRPQVHAEQQDHFGFVRIHHREPAQQDHVHHEGEHRCQDSGGHTLSHGPDEPEHRGRRNQDQQQRYHHATREGP